MKRPIVSLLRHGLPWVGLAGLALEACGGLPTPSAYAAPGPDIPSSANAVSEQDEYLDSMTPLPAGVEELSFIIGTQPPLVDALRRSGAHDLDCPAAQLTLHSRRIHGFTELYTADGCGKRAVYLLEYWDKGQRHMGAGWLAHFVLISRVTLASGG